jgi:endoglucanase
MMENQQYLFNLLRELVAIPATSGFEQKIAKKVYPWMKNYADKAEVDQFGNVYGYLYGESGAPMIIVPAHADSVGFVISHIEENGVLRFDAIGLIPPVHVYGQRMTIVTSKGNLTGVVATKPGHISFHTEDAKKVPSIDEMFIDIGAETKQQAIDMGVEVGIQTTFERNLEWLGDESTDWVTSRSLDDKVGCLVIMEGLKRLREGKNPLYANVCFVATAQEEPGLRGAWVTGYRVKPDMCIGVDASVSAAGFGYGVGKSPNTTFSEAANQLNGGPGIGVCDGWVGYEGLISNPKLREHLKSAAIKKGIRYQMEGHMPFITSDPCALQYLGVPSITIKIPSRYTHGPVEVCSLRDIEECIQLLIEALKSVDKDFNLDFIDISNL